MLKKILINIYLLLSAILFVSKLEAKVIKANGYYINQMNDTLKKTFILPLAKNEELNFNRFQSCIEIYDSLLARSKTLIPDSIKEFCIYLGERRILMRSVYYDNNYLFLHVLISGKLTLYEYDYKFNSPINKGGSTNYSTTKNYVYVGYGNGYTVKLRKDEVLLASPEPRDTKKILQNRKGELLTVSKLGFKKKLSILLNDCPAVLEKINEDEFYYNEVERIPNFYNSKCN